MGMEGMAGKGRKALKDALEVYDAAVSLGGRLDNFPPEELPERIEAALTRIGTRTENVVRAATLAGGIVSSSLTGVPDAQAQDAPNLPSYAHPAPKEQVELDVFIEKLAHAPKTSFGPEFFSGEDLKCLTDNTYYEARGEGVEGRYAVIFATLSRVLDKHYPKTVCGVVHQPWQFSWTMDKGLRALPVNPREYLEIAQQVKHVTEGHSLDEATILAGMHAGLPSGAIFYKRVGFQGSAKVQEFFGGLRSVAVIGHHEFFVKK